MINRLEKIKEELSKLEPANFYGTTCPLFHLSENNVLKSELSKDWIVQTPGKWGKLNDYDPEVYSKAISSAILEAVEAGKKNPKAHIFIDIMNLNFLGDRVYKKVLKPAFEELFKSNLNGVIRYLEGSQISEEQNKEHKLLTLLSRDFNNYKNINITVYAAKLCFPVVSDEKLQKLIGILKDGSWIHAKVLAVNGQTCIVGGHNLWDDYISEIPKTADLSICIHGEAAHNTHLFCNFFWNYINKPETGGLASLSYWNGGSELTPITEQDRQTGKARKVPLFVEEFKNENVYKPSPSCKFFVSKVQVLSVGKLGLFNVFELWDDIKKNYENFDKPLPWLMEPFRLFEKDPYKYQIVASRLARCLLLESAQLTIRIAQQKLALPRGEIKAEGYLPNIEFIWSIEILIALGKAMKNGVNIQIVTSPLPPSENKGEGYKEYFNDASPDEFFSALEQSMTKQLGMTQEDAQALRKKHLQLKTISYVKNEKISYETHYNCEERKLDERKSKRVCNHSKFYMVDDEAFYIGSDNVYPAWLIEYGHIIDNRTASDYLLKNYWNKLWENSDPVGVKQ